MTDTSPLSRIVYRGVVHPWECDAMGHLTTRFYMAMFDDASWHFFHEVGYRAGEAQPEGVGWADVSHKIDYLAEARAGSLIVIHAHPVKAGGKSLAYVLEMRLADDDTPLARMEAVSVQFDMGARKAVPLMDSVRRGVADWLEG